MSPPRVVILFGPPGAGKGTQASRLAAALSLPHISTGDILRANREQGTALGRRAQEFMDAGKLVPDDLVLEMLFDRVTKKDCARGYLLDGFPRTLPQAEELARRLPKDAAVQVVNIAVSDRSLVDRITGRRICRSCKNIHHVKTAPPKVSGRCDRCGGELEQRVDDTEGVLRERLAVYRRQTQPVEAAYRSRGLLVEIDGDRTPDAVFESLRQAVSEGVRA
ncbi:MAG: adenylate kinase [Planctomycetota bacterium]